MGAENEMVDVDRGGPNISVEFCASHVASGFGVGWIKVGGKPHAHIMNGTKALPGVRARSRAVNVTTLDPETHIVAKRDMVTG